MTIFKRILIKSTIEKKSDEMVNIAMKSAKEAREITNQKIEDIYAQLNGCGDRWFLTPHSSIDECNKKGIEK